MTQATELSLRLDLLGWSISDLTRAYCLQEGIEPNRANMRLQFDTISRAVQNSDSVGFGRYKKILAAAGGTLVYQWVDTKNLSRNILTD